MNYYFKERKQNKKLHKKLFKIFLFCIYIVHAYPIIIQISIIVNSLINNLI